MEDKQRAMMPELSPEKPEPLWIRLVGNGGAVALLAMAFIVPLLVLPVTMYRDFDTERPETLITKQVGILVLGTVVLAFAAVALATERWRRYLGHAAIPSAALSVFVLWGFAAVLLNPIPSYSLYLAMPVLLPAVVALGGPLLVGGWRHGTAFVVTMLACGTLVAAIAVFTVAGFTTFMKWAYGFDPREVASSPELWGYLPEGGATRSLAMSTITNAEYAGSFAAAVAALGAVVLLDWMAAGRARWWWRLGVLGILGLLLLHLGLTGTRQPWISLGMAGLLRGLIELRIPARVLAAGYCGFLLVLFFGGVVAGAATALLLLAVVLVSTWRSGALADGWVRMDSFTRVLFVGGPAVVLALVVAFSTPGPWNPAGLRLAQRFTTLTDANDESVRERTLMFMAASEMAWEHPLFGVGPGRYSNRMAASLYRLLDLHDTGALFHARADFVRKIADQAHNDYLQIAAEMGLGALLAFLTMVVALLAGLWRIVRSEDGPRRRVALALLICLVTFLGMMLTSFPLHMPSRSAFFWVLVAMCLGLLAEGDRTARAGATDA